MTALAVREVTKAFGGVVAVDRFSLSVGAGEVVGLMGPNGAGKSTAINLVSGVYRPDRGAVELDDRPITGLRPSRIVRAGLTRSFQATVLFAHATVAENLARGEHLFLETPLWQAVAGCRRAREREQAAAESVRELLAFSGLEPWAGHLAGSLPYGHQKVLGVTMALATRPRVLLLDEPAAGLNAEEASAMAAIIRRINARGVTLVVVDHNVRFMMDLCGRIVVMHHGRKIAEGEPAEIRSDPRVIEAYLGRADGAP